MLYSVLVTLLLLLDVQYNHCVCIKSLFSSLLGGNCSPPRVSEGHSEVDSGVLQKQITGLDPETWRMGKI